MPPKNKGRQVYIKDKVGVSQEEVRRWFEGASRPRPKLMKKLAELLRVDEAWLALGIEPEFEGDEKKDFSAKAGAADYLAFGLFMANGYTCAFGEKKGDPDFYAIRRGVQRSISVTVGRVVGRGICQIPVSTDFENVVNVVVIYTGKASFDTLVMDPEMIAEFGKSTGPYIEIIADKHGDDYATAGKIWTPIAESDLF